jgi:hypothetical protein
MPRRLKIVTMGPIPFTVKRAWTRPKFPRWRLPGRLLVPWGYINRYMITARGSRRQRESRVSPNLRLPRRCRFGLPKPISVCPCYNPANLTKGQRVRTSGSFAFTSPRSQIVSRGTLMMVFWEAKIQTLDQGTAGWMHTVTSLNRTSRMEISADSGTASSRVGR